MNIFDPNNKRFNIRPGFLISIVLFVIALVATRKEVTVSPKPATKPAQSMEIVPEKNTEKDPFSFEESSSRDKGIISMTELPLAVLYEVVGVNNLGKSPLPRYAGRYEIIVTLRDASGKETKARVYEASNAVIKPGQKLRIMKVRDGGLSLEYWDPDEKAPSVSPPPQPEQKPITASFRKEVAVFLFVL